MSAQAVLCGRCETPIQVVKGKLIHDVTGKVDCPELAFKASQEFVGE